MTPLFLTDVIVHWTHHTTTYEKVMRAFTSVLGEGCIEQIHMFPKKDRHTGENYWKIAINFSKLDYIGHTAEENVRLFNDGLRSGGEICVYFAELSPNGKRYFIRCVVDQKIVRRNGQEIPDLFRGRSSATENITTKKHMQNIAQRILL